jgi:hypothetical protein
LDELTRIERVGIDTADSLAPTPSSDTTTQLELGHKSYQILATIEMTMSIVIVIDKF